jgi:hypothetical protein
MPTDLNSAVSESKSSAQESFDRTALKYREEPTDENFFQLSRSKPGRDERAQVTAVVYSVVGPMPLGLPTLSHLVNALAIEERFQEAAYFAGLWLAKAPSSLEALRLSCILSCKLMDLAGARSSFQSLQRSNATPGVLWAMETLMLLSFFDGSHANETARHMMGSTPYDPMAPLIAAEVAFHCEDASLLTTALLADPHLAEDSPPRVAKAMLMLRQLLLRILHLRCGNLGDES